MLIECPACHARTKLSDEKEGAKVRCGECGAVHLAVKTAERSRARSAVLYVGLGVLALGAAALVLIRNAAGDASYEADEALEVGNGLQETQELTGRDEALGNRAEKDR